MLYLVTVSEDGRKRNQRGSGARDKRRELWKEIARVASIQNLQERTSTMKLLLYPGEYADVSLPKPPPRDRGGCTFSLKLVSKIGAANGRKRR